MVLLPSCPGAFLASVLLLALLSEAHGKRCPIPNIENGRIVEDSEFRLGDRITFVCDEGYRPIGRNGARCVLRNNQVVWDTAPPHCQRIPCRPPPTIANGVYEEHSDYTYGTAVTYRCESPFSLIGEKTIVCISDQDMNGQWSGPAPECKGSCGPPTRLYFAELIEEYRSQTSFPVGSTVKYKCQPGYYGPKTSLKCLESLEWSEAPNFCKEKSCENPGEPANGRLIVPKDLNFGSTVNFICDEGYRLIGPSSIRCIITGQKVGWSGRIPFCQHGTLLPSSGPNVTSLSSSQAPPVTVPTYTSALPTLQTELAWEKLFIILQETKDTVNIKTTSLEERLNELEKKVDKVISELKTCCQHAKERLEEEYEQ